MATLIHLYPKGLPLLFNSYAFIFLFLPFVFFTFHFLKYRYPLAAKVFLILASLFFYAYWKLAYLPILLFSILINYFLAVQILKLKFQVNTTHNHTLSMSGGGGRIFS